MRRSSRTFASMPTVATRAVLDQHGLIRRTSNNARPPEEIRLRHGQRLSEPLDEVLARSQPVLQLPNHWLPDRRNAPQAESSLAEAPLFANLGEIEAEEMEFEHMPPLSRRRPRSRGAARLRQPDSRYALTPEPTVAVG